MSCHPSGHWHPVKGPRAPSYSAVVVDPFMSLALPGDYLRGAFSGVCCNFLGLTEPENLVIYLDY